MWKMTMWKQYDSVKGVAHEPTENYHLNLQLPSELYSEFQLIA